MTSPSPAKRFNWGNLRMRVVSATVLVPTVVAAVWLGGFWILALALVCVALLAREWGKISAPKAPRAVGGQGLGEGRRGHRRHPTEVRARCKRKRRLEFLASGERFEQPHMSAIQQIAHPETVSFTKFQVQLLVGPSVTGVRVLVPRPALDAARQAGGHRNH